MPAMALRVAYGPYENAAKPCAFKGPICSSPGYAIETLNLGAQMFGLQLNITEVAEFGLGTPDDDQDSAMRMLFDGRVDLLGPDYEVPKEFNFSFLPLGVDNLGAVIRTPQSLSYMANNLVEYLKPTTLTALIASFVFCYTVRTAFMRVLPPPREWFTKGVVKVLHLPLWAFSLLIFVVLGLYSSELSIFLVRPAVPSLPFTSLEGLVHLANRSEFKVIVSFNDPGPAAIAMKLFGSLDHPALIAPTVNFSDNFEVVAKSWNVAFITYKSIGEPHVKKYCGALQFIQDKNIPERAYGFLMALDGPTYLRHNLSQVNVMIIARHYDYLMKRTAAQEVATVPCVDSTSEQPETTLSLTRAQRVVFEPWLIGLTGCFIVWVLELIGGWVKIGPLYVSFKRWRRRFSKPFMIYLS